MSWGYRYGRRWVPAKPKPQGPRQDLTKDDDGSLAKRIAAALADTTGNLDARGKEFLTSISGYLAKNGGLTPGQFKYFEVLEKKLASANDSNWITEYDAEKQANFERCIEYYAHTGSYFSSVVQSYRANPTGYRPTRELYEKVCNNKYTSRLLKIFKEESVFEAGDLVSVKRIDKQPTPTLVRYITHRGGACAQRSGRYSTPAPTTANPYGIPVWEPICPSNTWIVVEVNPFLPCAMTQGQIVGLKPIDNMNDPHVWYCEEKQLKKA